MALSSHPGKDQPFHLSASASLSVIIRVKIGDIHRPGARCSAVTGNVLLDLQHPMRDMPIFPLYRWRKLRHMEIEKLSQGLTVSGFSDMVQSI